MAKGQGGRPEARSEAGRVQQAKREEEVPQAAALHAGLLWLGVLTAPRLCGPPLSGGSQPLPRNARRGHPAPSFGFSLPQSCDLTQTSQLPWNTGKMHFMLRLTEETKTQRSLMDIASE